MTRFTSDAGKLLQLAMASLSISVLGILGCGNRPPDDGQAADRSLRLTVESIGDLDVSEEDGTARKIKDYSGDDKLVVVVSRGYFGDVCPFCCAQTQSLASRYSDIENQGARLVVVFPVQQVSDQVHAGQLVEAARIELNDPQAEFPFPIAFDVQLRLVDQLGIRALLAQPATFILDRQGKVSFSYVGRDPADRPNVETIVTQLQAIK
jgi:peroxiredoxin